MIYITYDLRETRPLVPHICLLYTSSIKNPDINPPKFNKEESGFNDVVVGFDKGIEVAQRKNV